MGAPGIILVCEKGHMGAMYDSGLSIEDIKECNEWIKSMALEGCWCGAKYKYKFYHYNCDINDCLDKKIRYSRLRKKYKIKEKKLNSWNYV